MLAKIFLELTEYPWFRRLVWRPIYQSLASKFKNENWHFMNYGYDPSEIEDALMLPDEENIDRYAIQLYHYLAVKTIIEGKDIVEVGSGRGGGSRYIAKYLKPQRMTGMDLASNAVAFSAKNHQLPNLIFFTGNAESIPLEDESMDVVINVESCHAYGSVDNFLKEVKRILRPGGVLLLTDVRGEPGMKKLVTQLKNSGLVFLEEEDITKNVVRAIEKENDTKWNRIQETVPKWLQHSFGEFGGVVGSQIHLQLKKRDLIYYRFMLIKEK